jgi:PIN domain nuclease of toxin-antitoxin system
VRLLIDTQAFLWANDAVEKLSHRAKRAILNPRNECVLSMASCWEMGIKVKRERLKLPFRFEALPDLLAEMHMDMLPISLKHIARIGVLPLFHKDPFDRLLVAQAMEEGLRVVSSDREFNRYGIERVW